MNLAYKIGHRYLKYINCGYSKTSGESLDKANVYVNRLIIKTVRLVLIVILSSILFYIVIAIKYNGCNNNSLIRDTYGGDVKTYHIIAVNGEKIDEIDYEVEALVYTKRQLTEEIDRIYTYLDEKMLGDNKALYKVTSDLNLVTEIPDSCIEISWKSGDIEYIDDDGHVYNESLQGSVQTYVEVILEYDDYSFNKRYDITIFPASYTKDELALKELEESLYEYEQENRFSESFILPESLAGYKISQPIKNKAHYILILGLIVVVVTIVKPYVEMKERLKLRDKALVNEYPVFVNRLCLLLGSGLTMQSCVVRLRDEYKLNNDTSHPKNCKSKKGYNYLYHELNYMVNQLESGISMMSSLRDLSYRINNINYTHLFSIITTNLNKGTRGLLPLLKQEEVQAFIKRKELAKKAGEEASTKLLVPMIMLMTVVMVIIMIPALIKF